jgi:deoxyribodipyrimidine photolyase-related protein
MSAVRLVLGDQLCRGLSALRDIDPVHDVVFMAELWDEATYVRHHKQKLVLVFSAMRHFAEGLRGQGIRVDYVPLDAPGNTGSLTEELRRAIGRHRADRVIATEPGEWRLWEAMQEWAPELGVGVEVRADDRFLISREDFARWAVDRRALRMEHFYREMRRRTKWLMNDSKPEGGRWNFDAENRRALPVGFETPSRPGFPPDGVTAGVMALVEREFSGHFGDLSPFAWAVTRVDALKALEGFLTHSLPRFGDFQDAMRQGEDFLFHSALSPYINLGLLTAREVCEAALGAWRRGEAPLNAVEGFIRQIAGWREYVRGLYWSRMPGYRETNFLGAGRGLPWFYWTGDTRLNCVRQCIEATRRNAYAHHIQRLMVTGNFALLAGISPREVEEWYLIVYADAFEWVELPNTHGMALHADGGLLGSKPYAASGSYIDRMSDYCRACDYDPRIKMGEGACPFNCLYWDFLLEHREKLGRNPRLAVAYRTLAAMTDERRSEIRDDARTFLASPEMRPG